MIIYIVADYLFKVSLPANSLTLETKVSPDTKNYVFLLLPKFFISRLKRFVPSYLSLLRHVLVNFRRFIQQTVSSFRFCLETKLEGVTPIFMCRDGRYCKRYLFFKVSKLHILLYLFYEALFIVILKYLTALSAKPFDAGWYGSEVKCLIPLLDKNDKTPLKKLQKHYL